MRWLSRLVFILPLTMLAPATSRILADPSTDQLYTPLIQTSPTCAVTCGKSGINTAVEVLLPEDDYLSAHAKRVTDFCQQVVDPLHASRAHPCS